VNSSATRTGHRYGRGVSIGDSIAGIYAAFGAVMALFEQESRRGGDQVPARVPLQHRIIDVALNESVLSVMESLVPDYLAYGINRQRVGGRMEGIAPSNAYPCGDDTSIIIAGNGDAIFQRFMETIGRPDLGSDPDLLSNAGRWRRPRNSTPPSPNGRLGSPASRR
jgi:formyl-CoA transferase